MNSFLRRVANRLGPPVWLRTRHGWHAIRGTVSAFGHLARLAVRAGLAGRRLVVIAQTERLGDIVACTPVARYARDAHPGAIIAWAARPAYFDVLRGNPDIDHLVPLPCITAWVWLRRFVPAAVVYDLHPDRKECAECRVPLRKGGRGRSVDVENYYDHGPLLAAFARGAGLPRPSSDPVLVIDPAVRAAVDRLGLPDRYVCVHTLSEEDSRNWTADGWRRLIDWVNAERGLPVVEVGLRSPLGRSDGPLYRNLCGACGIQETAEVIRRATAFVGVDSGPAHLGNAVRTPGVVILGAYRRWPRYLPYTGFYADPANCRVLRHTGPSTGLPVETCLEALGGLLDTLHPTRKNTVADGT